MEPVASVVDRIKGFAKSTDQFVRDALERRFNRHRHNPIEILKRLQREVFFDLMKLRDRQEKIERMFAFYKSGKGSPFQEANTHIKGIINMTGALLLHDDQVSNFLDSSGLNTGIDSRFIFETTIRQKDALVAEFVACQKNHYYGQDVIGSPLALAKVMYLANINNLLSVITIPFGARCNDFRTDSDLVQCMCLTGFSSVCPPLFNQYHDYAAGLTIKVSNVTASFAELISGLRMPLDAVNWRSTLSTFGQISYQLSEETNLTLSGVWKMASSLSPPIKLGSLTIPSGNFGSHSRSGAMGQTSSRTTGSLSGGSIAMMLDIDESTKFGAWVEVQKSSPSLLQLAISLSDTPEDETGWGFIMRGRVEGQLNLFQLESYLNFSFGKRVNVQPGFVYAMDGRNRTPALVFRSSWSM